MHPCNCGSVRTLQRTLTLDSHWVLPHLRPNSLVGMFRGRREEAACDDGAPPDMLRSMLENTSDIDEAGELTSALLLLMAIAGG